MVAILLLALAVFTGYTIGKIQDRRRRWLVNQPDLCARWRKVWALSNAQIRKG